MEKPKNQILDLTIEASQLESGEHCLSAVPTTSGVTYDLFNL